MHLQIARTAAVLAPPPIACENGPRLTNRGVGFQRLHRSGGPGSKEEDHVGDRELQSKGHSLEWAFQSVSTQR